MTLEAVEGLIQKYIAAWSEPDAEARRTLLDAVWDTNAIYTDPVSYADTQAELDAIIAQVLAVNPGTKFTLRHNVNFHHHHVRFYWVMELTDGRAVHGMDYGEVTPDGKLAKIVGFF